MNKNKLIGDVIMVNEVHDLKIKLDSIKGESGRLKKEGLLSTYKGDKLFDDTLYFLLNPFITTGIAKNKLNKKVKGESESKLKTLNDVYEYIKENNTGKDVDILEVKGYINHLEDKDLMKFVSDLVTKSYKCGITAKTVNKVYGKGFIPEYSVQLAESFSKRPEWVKGKFYITTKLDGHRLTIIIKDGKVKFYTRTGKEVTGFNEVEEDVLKLGVDNYVFDGEILSTNFTDTTSVVNSKGVKEGLIYYVFDCLPLGEFLDGESKLKYGKRREELSKIFTTDYEHIKLIPVLYEGEDIDVIPEYLDQEVSKGEEGIMINLDVTYKTKRHKGLLKVKKFISDDLKCLGIFEGEGKYEGTLGGIYLNYKGNKIACGSGFNDEQRDFYYNNPDEIVGKIVEIQYFEETTNKKDDKLSVRFPVFKGVREDKTEESLES